jgi:hypothetical protein
VSGLNQQFAKLRMGLNLSTGSNPVPSTITSYDEGTQLGTGSEGIIHIGCYQIVVWRKWHPRRPVSAMRNYEIK